MFTFLMNCSNNLRPSGPTTFARYLRGALTETVPLRGQNAGLRGDRNAAPTQFPQPRRRDFIDL
jgi:hypothetical protein